MKVNQVRVQAVSHSKKGKRRKSKWFRRNFAVGILRDKPRVQPESFTWRLAQLRRLCSISKTYFKWLYIGHNIKELALTKDPQALCSNKSQMVKNKCSVLETIFSVDEKDSLQSGHESYT